MRLTLFESMLTIPRLHAGRFSRKLHGLVLAGTDLIRIGYVKKSDLAENFFFLFLISTAADGSTEHTNTRIQNSLPIIALQIGPRSC
jgi:hypothetical protein